MIFSVIYFTRNKRVYRVMSTVLSNTAWPDCRILNIVLLKYITPKDVG